MENKRRYIRVRPHEWAPVEIQLNGVDFLDILYAEDISEGGARINVPHEFSGCTIDAAIDLVITLPEYRSFKARGRIRHVGNTRTAFGVEFISLEESSRQQLRGYVQEVHDSL